MPRERKKYTKKVIKETIRLNTKDNDLPRTRNFIKVDPKVAVSVRDIRKYPTAYGAEDIDREIKMMQKQWEPKNTTSQKRRYGGGGSMGAPLGKWEKDPKTGRRIFKVL